ncbi:Activator of heat shock protein ATPase [Paragonimus heterotremus]|uniref:Activator of heat shock protein ATPase n=1 Tax=Paragonimus heterotremus TaxID=100268 RepID=A0A8J4T2R5_9TREM|nr:Activator of heat shock protein ATPase [Paragonimus heterotremus]
MAKWGQGDPRWIVEERADAKNVNNWHWTEKNATQWSIEMIKKIFATFHVENDDFLCENLNVTKCEGEAHVNNRKGKLIFFYEWQIEADWSGELKTGNNKTRFNGKVEIPNLSEEFTVDELDVNVTCSSSSQDGNAIKKFMQAVGAQQIRTKLGEYLQKLKDEYSRNLILPTKDNNTTPTDPANTRACPPFSSIEQKRNDPETVSQKPKDLSIKELVVNDEFFCTPDDLYKVLTSKELVQAFTRGEAVVEAHEGGQYSIFGGNITGMFTILIPGKTIGMQWRKRDWPEGHQSMLLLQLSPFEGGCKLNLLQTGVPAYDLENTTNGWRTNFFAAIKQTYGYTSRMF